MIQDLSGSWCIKGADKSILVMDSSVFFLSLNQENILGYLAESDGNIRILIATIAYEMGVYNQGVKVIIQYGPSRNIETYHYKNGREGRNTPVHCRFHVKVLF